MRIDVFCENTYYKCEGFKSSQKFLPMDQVRITPRYSDQSTKSKDFMARVPNLF